MVLDVDERDRKISLGMKQIEPNPWSLIEEKYPVGTHVSGTDPQHHQLRVFVGLEEGIDGLVHVSDISWTEQIKHPEREVQEGRQVEAVVLKIDKENEKFSLGIKQLQANPWDDILQEVPGGHGGHGRGHERHRLRCVREARRGHRGADLQLGARRAERVENPAEVVSVGRSVTALVTKVDPSSRRSRLSIRALTDREQREALKKLAAQQSASADDHAGRPPGGEARPAEGGEDPRRGLAQSAGGAFSPAQPQRIPSQLRGEIG